VSFQFYFVELTVFVFEETLLSSLFMSCQQYPEYFIPTYLFMFALYAFILYKCLAFVHLYALDDSDRKNAVLLPLQRGTRSNFEDMIQNIYEILRIIILSLFLQNCHLRNTQCY